jgi:hypothetical protein
MINPKRYCTKKWNEISDARPQKKSNFFFSVSWISYFGDSCHITGEIQVLYGKKLTIPTNIPHSTCQANMWAALETSHPAPDMTAAQAGTMNTASWDSDSEPSPRLSHSQKNDLQKGNMSCFNLLNSWQINHTGIENHYTVCYRLNIFE